MLYHFITAMVFRYKGAELYIFDGDLFNTDTAIDHFTQFLFIKILIPAEYPFGLYFIAFKAAIELLKESGRESLLTELLDKCKELQRNNQLHTENVVRHIYKPFTPEEISAKIAQLISPKEIEVPVEVIYQKIETLHESCPNNKGDWYFTGNYPTPGGNRVCNKAFMNYMEGKNVRGY